MEREIIVGKYTLESLTNGMYASPFDLYREYIQNAVDSFDCAIKKKIDTEENFKLEINIDSENKIIRIKDNGCGIKKNHVIETLTDIGNSKKNRKETRGFRGIGRLAGLGYCDTLIFTTSVVGENEKTSVQFDAKELRKLLLTDDEASVNEVIDKIVSINQAPNKVNEHFFEVELLGVGTKEGLLDLLKVEDYLLQHAPIPFNPNFQWKDEIIEKMRIFGCFVKSYQLTLNKKKLFKPYLNSFESDRVKHKLDFVKEVHICPFFRNNNLSAVLWYAETDSFGTILNNQIKGIRLRQGNILIGDKSTCNHFFKEERFNGWQIGELHIVDSDLIVNSRRDDFEKNEAYYSLKNNFEEWANIQSKAIRKASYERNLTKKEQIIIEAENIDDINELCEEDMSFAEEFGESDYLDYPESIMVAETDYIQKLSNLLNQRNNYTKYNALNINTKLTQEQRKVLERVFDLVVTHFPEESNSIIETIAERF